MVARIIRGKDIVGLIKYNEKEKSKVLCAHLINEFKEPDELTLQDKISAFKMYLNRNPKITNPTFHVSLNPDVSDNLADEQLQAIGEEYMERMNYGNQPYLIYKHEDIARIHIHIVSVSVGLDGKVISSSKDRYRSEEIRKDLEKRYNLVQAEEKIKKGENKFEPVDIAAIEYGKTDTKSAIANVVRSAVRDYTCRSMAAFRILLQRYHVAVEEVKASKNSDQTLGLFYVLVNNRGRKVSSRIKASAISPEVGYGALQEKFSRDAIVIQQQQVREQIRQQVDLVFQAFPQITMTIFSQKLRENGIEVVFQETKAGQVKNVGFILISQKVVLDSQDIDPSWMSTTLTAQIF